MSAPRYTPYYAATPYGQVKVFDSSTEYNAIQAAFSALDSYDTFTSSGQISATQRNVLVDPSGVINTQVSITVMLPANPVVGDPPCRVTLLSDSYSTGSFTNSFVTVQGDTGNNDPIMGSLINLPRLYNGGATIQLRWIGGTIGWMIEELELGTQQAATQTSCAGPAVQTDKTDQYAFPGEEIMIGAAWSPALQLTHLPVGVGQRFFFTLSGADILIGSSALSPTDTVNGSTVPVTFTSQNNRYCVTCLGANGSGGFTYICA